MSPAFDAATPFFSAPVRKAARCFAISSAFFLPMARRSTSAPPSVKPASTWAICITCSW